MQRFTQVLLDCFCFVRFGRCDLPYKSVDNNICGRGPVFLAAADESSNGPVQPLKNGPFCDGYWEVVPIPQTYRYSAIGICADCRTMVMAVDERATLASAMKELVRRINARSNSDSDRSATFPKLRYASSARSPTFTPSPSAPKAHRPAMQGETMPALQCSRCSTQTDSSCACSRKQGEIISSFFTPWVFSCPWKKKQVTGFIPMTCTFSGANERIRTADLRITR